MASGSKTTIALVAALLLISCWLAPAADRPNILWITSEDNGPYLGCYGDPVARTPNLDALAEEGVRYSNCFSNAAVCAPARQTLISGMLASSIGGQHMRSNVDFPEGVPYFPKWLREAGYYTGNNSKTDYNGGPAGNRKAAMTAAWDESGRNAHWRKRPEGKPFFSVFNFTDSHESRLFPQRWKNRELKTDPAKVKVPAYLPDTPEVRLDLARYYDCIEDMDARVGALLGELEADGLEDDTIVFYYSDHGGSLPRGKSFIYDSGTHVPLIVRVPDKWSHVVPGTPGSTTERLVSFVDFAPTVLSLAGIEPPAYMQGRAFLGRFEAEPRAYVHLFRGRRGERYDQVRGVRDGKFLYLRNYSPHRPVMQPNTYSWAIPSYAAWRKAWLAGELPEAQSQWYAAKPAEELYRVSDDPDNMNNLAGNPEFADVVKRFRGEHQRHLLEVRDTLFYPEGVTGRGYAACQDESTYPLKRLMRLADKAIERDPGNLEEFRRLVANENPCIRWWAVTGCVMLGERAQAAAPELKRLLKDPEPTVQIEAARGLAGAGMSEAALPVLKKHLKQGRFPHALQATLAIDEYRLGSGAPQLQSILEGVREPYARRVAEWMLKLDPAGHAHGR